jgi:phage-related protein
MKTMSIFNSVDNALFTIDRDEMGSLEGFEYASVRPAIEDVAGNHGASYLASKQGRRRFSFQCLIRDQTLANKRTMLLALRQTSSMKLLKFTTLDDLTLQASVEILAVRYPYSSIPKPFLIEMVAPDWRFYSQTLHQTAVPLDTPTAVSNAGNENTYPVYVITGPGNGFTVSDADGNSFLVDYELLDDSTIEVDTEENTVKLGDGTSIFPDFSGDFFGLEPGAVNITFSVGSGDDTTTGLSVDFRDAYNGV